MTSRSSNWTIAEMKCLISTWKETKIAQILASKKRNTKAYEKMAELLYQGGYLRTKEQIQTKVKSMRQSYDKAKYRMKKSGESSEVWKTLCPLYQEMDEFLGCKPLSNPHYKAVSEEAHEKDECNSVPDVPPLENVPHSSSKTKEFAVVETEDKHAGKEIVKRKISKPQPLENNDGAIAGPSGLQNKGFPNSMNDSLVDDEQNEETDVQNAEKSDEDAIMPVQKRLRLNTPGSDNRKKKGGLAKNLEIQEEKNYEEIRERDEALQEKHDKLLEEILDIQKQQSRNNEKDSDFMEKLLTQHKEESKALTDILGKMMNILDKTQPSAERKIVTGNMEGTTSVTQPLQNQGHGTANLPTFPNSYGFGSQHYAGTNFSTNILNVPPNSTPSCPQMLPENFSSFMGYMNDDIPAYKHL